MESQTAHGGRGDNAPATKHTPGPWTLGPAVKSNHSLVYKVVHAGEKRLCACSVYGKKGDQTKTFTDAEVDANARLISAAPDLLAACEEAIVLIEFFHGRAGWNEYQQSPEMKRLRATIAKAGGEA